MQRRDVLTLGPASLASTRSPPPAGRLRMGLPGAGLRWRGPTPSSVPYLLGVPNLSSPRLVYRYSDGGDRPAASWCAPYGRIDAVNCPSRRASDANALMPELAQSGSACTPRGQLEDHRRATALNRQAMPRAGAPTTDRGWAATCPLIAGTHSGGATKSTAPCFLAAWKPPNARPKTARLQRPCGRGQEHYPADSEDSGVAVPPPEQTSHKKRAAMLGDGDAWCDWGNWHFTTAAPVPPCTSASILPHATCALPNTPRVLITSPTQLPTGPTAEIRLSRSTTYFLCDRYATSTKLNSIWGRFRNCSTTLTHPPIEPGECNRTADWFASLGAWWR
jgi:hypothetical protein